ncbi:uncharacterized protein TRIADDRAFT_55446 [Trichoplax adhaerens]|uniref:Death domain-containing protein n=1 Tax=Trichoplax adhaerens TaxID=10228 RepID=B3RUX3_TRIAD|nr:predicted protein [Trichoplax adhaerens]EDV25393.1 predicted protein [Trichoplax adhaerens]|eukprot:XP_002111426.1 predicted protein [Trichoplax adhaerens]
MAEESLAKSLLIEEAFYTALANGNVKASRARCLFLGDKNSGKSSLFRVLSGQMSKVMRKMSLISDADDAMTSDGILARTRSDSLLPPGLDALMDSAGESDEVFRDDIPLRPQRRSSFIRSSNQQGWSPNNSISSESGSTSGNQASGSSSNPQLSDFDRHAGKLIAHALKQLYFRNTNKSKLAECSTWDKRIPYDSVVSYLKSTSSTVTEDLNSTARLRLDFWDISGHKLTRSVHHVHLAKFGVNLIVFNAVSMLAQEEKQLQSLHYWLNSIRTYTTPTTPVLLVGTHGDELSSDDIKNINRQLNKHFMQSFGGQIARSSYDSVMFLVESQHGIKDEGAARLLEKMFDCARRQEYSTHAIPLSWVMFREQLTRLHKEHNIRCVTVSSLRKLARQVCNITSEQEQTQVLEYLHHGRKIIYPGILHGVKKDHVILNTFVIIDTQCVLEAITALIYQPSHCKETKHFQHKWERLTNYAVVDTDLMLHAWKNSKEPSEVLVSLMEALHIIYRIDDNCDFLTSHLKEKKTLQEFDSKRPGLFSSMKPARFIMPYLLKNQMDESFWEVSLDDISFYFDFHGFLPQPIFMYTIIDIMSQRGKNASLTTTICQTGGIFSLFDDIYHFNLQLYAEKCQFKITARCKEGYSAWYLMNELNVMVKNICDKHFPDVFYHCGPACPMDRCLSADQAFNRVHVLKVDFLNPNAALQCGQIRVDEHPHVKEWLPDDNIEATIAALKDRKNEQSLDNHIDHLSQSTHDELCRLLNQHTPSVKDWRWLALELMEITTQQLVRFKLQDSPSSSLLAEWGKKSHSTVQLLIKKLQDIKRDDCVQILSQWIENHF